MDDKLLNRGVRLALEIGLSLKIELEGVDLPLESSFVGFINEFIIITPPRPYNQIRHKLFEGTEMLIRYFYNGTIFAFQSKLFAHVEKPINLLFIEYPKLIQKSELRSEKRSNCYVETTFVSGDKENAGAIVDLFSHWAGKFVCATAGPNLETIMAAHGSGAVFQSKKTGKTI